MLFDWREGLFAGGGVDKSGGVVPCKCKGCGRVVSAKGVKQSVQVCPRCRVGGSRKKPKR